MFRYLSHFLKHNEPVGLLQIAVQVGGGGSQTFLYKPYLHHLLCVNILMLENLTNASFIL